MSDDRLDFFISYTQADRAWAQWVAWEREDDGHSTGDSSSTDRDS